MTFKFKKLLTYILIILLFMSAGLILYILTSYKGDFPQFSAYSTEENGIKALYSLTQKMGFAAERYHYPAMFLEDGIVMVAFRPDLNVFNSESEKESLKEWILRGNTLILIPDWESLESIWVFDIISEMKQRYEIISIGDVTVTEYELSSGSIYVMDQSAGFLNSEIKNSDASVAFIRVLERIKPARVVFNEYYHLMQKPAPGILNLIGVPGQLIFIQLLLAAVLAVVKGWKPFGRIRCGSKLEKRPENEVITALSGLYIRMRAYPLVLSNYYGYFMKKYERFLSMPGALQDETGNVLYQCRMFIERGDGKRAELLRLIRKLEKLEKKINNPA